MRISEIAERESGRKEGMKEGRKRKKKNKKKRKSLNGSDEEEKKQKLSDLCQVR